MAYEAAKTSEAEWAVASWAFGLEHFATEATKRRLISASEQAAWLADLQTRDDAGTFFSSIMGCYVWGQRP